VTIQYTVHTHTCKRRISSNSQLHKEEEEVSVVAKEEQQPLFVVGVVSSVM
jgi:hypothetical protein